MPTTNDHDQHSAATLLRYHEWSRWRLQRTYCDCFACYGRYVERVLSGAPSSSDPKEAVRHAAAS